MECNRSNKRNVIEDNKTVTASVRYENCCYSNKKLNTEIG